MRRRRTACEDSITNNTDPLEKIKNILINKTFRIEEEIREKVLENKVFNKKLEIKTKHNNYYENNEKLEDDNSGQKIINIPIYKIEINRLSIKQVEKLLRYHYYKFYPNNGWKIDNITINRHKRENRLRYKVLSDKELKQMLKKFNFIQIGEYYQNFKY